MRNFDIAHSKMPGKVTLLKDLTEVETCREEDAHALLQQKRGDVSAYQSVEGVEDTDGERAVRRQGEERVVKEDADAAAEALGYSMELLDSRNTGVQKCPNSTMWPECKDCVPGLSDPHCDQTLGEVADVRGWIAAETVKRYGQKARGLHLYPYLETPAFQQRQGYAGNVLRKSKAQRVLDIGGYFSPIANFIKVDEDWCPELVWSIDPVYRGNSYGMPCGRGKFMKVVQSPHTVRSAWNDDMMKNTKFDAVVCIGCDPNFGPNVGDLLGFQRPFQLIIETIEELIRGQYKELATSVGKLIEEKTWHMPMPEKGTYYSSEPPHVKRLMCIINYGNERTQSEFVSLDGHAKT